MNQNEIAIANAIGAICDKPDNLSGAFGTFRGNIRAALATFTPAPSKAIVSAVVSYVGPKLDAMYKSGNWESARVSSRPAFIDAAVNGTRSVFLGNGLPDPFATAASAKLAK